MTFFLENEEFSVGFYLFFFWNTSVWKVGSLNSDYLHKMWVRACFVTCIHPTAFDQESDLLRKVLVPIFFESCKGIIRPLSCPVNRFSQKVDPANVDTSV